MTDDPEDLLDRIDDAEVLGVVTDAMGDHVKIGVLGSAALIGVSGSPGIFDKPEARAEVTRLWAEACRRADETTVAETTTITPEENKP